MSQPEMKIDTNGTKRWLLNGKHHREDGPAVEYTEGSKYWYLNGRCHREDGPAVERPNGTKFWYLNDEPVSWQEVFKKAKTEEIELRILSFVLTTS